MDANYLVNRSVVVGVIGVAWLLTLGVIVLAALGKSSPEWMGSVILSVTSGLIGFLAREIKQAAQAATGDTTRTTLLINETSPVDPSDAKEKL